MNPTHYGDKLQMNCTKVEIWTEIGLENSSDDMNVKKNATVLISTNIKLQ